MERRIEIVEAKVAELTGLGQRAAPTPARRPDRPVYFAVMHDSEGNEFWVG